MISKKKVFVSVFLMLLIAQSVAGVQPKKIQPVPQEQFTTVELLEPKASPTPSPSPANTPSPIFSKPPLPDKTAEAKLETPKPKIPKRPTRAQVKAYVRSKIGDKQFECISRLWTSESGWRWNAYNEKSGAYGIPQALPGRKMANPKNNGGPDWKTNPITQVNWGINYVKVRYGSACDALAYKRRIGWY